MPRKRKITNYLLLDKEDICHVCGSMTFDELTNKLSITPKQFDLWIDKVGILDNKYVVIEDA